MAVKGYWVSRRYRHTAPSPSLSQVSESVVVTHPFHPLYGQQLTVLFERRGFRAELVITCDGGPSERTTVPASWTDRNPPALNTRLTVEALSSLIGLITALASADNKRGV